MVNDAKSSEMSKLVRGVRSQNPNGFTGDGLIPLLRSSGYASLNLIFRYPQAFRLMYNPYWFHDTDRYR